MPAQWNEVVCYCMATLNTGTGNKNYQLSPSEKHLQFKFLWKECSCSVVYNLSDVAGAVL